MRAVTINSEFSLHGLSSNSNLNITTELDGRKSSRYERTITSNKILKHNEMEKIHWTSVYGDNEDNSYHFFSAYYDDRTPAPHRPAVIVMGYVSKRVPNAKLYCILRYSNGSRVCSKNPAIRKLGTCFNSHKVFKTFHNFCTVDARDEPPVSVAISSVKTCEPSLSSDEILVKNRYKNKVMKKFGVCVGGPIRQIHKRNGIFLQYLVDFIEMSRVLGAELITIYVTSMKGYLINIILSRYSDLLRMIQWKTFDSKKILYHGQLMMISDCFYRSMYDVEYLVLIDLDEMILPVHHKTWEGMIKNIHQSERFASYKFHNVFFNDRNVRLSKNSDILQSCNKKVPISRYLINTNRYICNPIPGEYRTKTISKPRLVLDTYIHHMCSCLDGYELEYVVPEAMGISAHYRKVIPKECKSVPTYRDETAQRFANDLCF